jgi:uncharacterized protein
MPVSIEQCGSGLLFPSSWGTSSGPVKDMTSTLDRLRRLKDLRIASAPAKDFTPATVSDQWSVERLIPGQAILAAGSACYVSTHAYPLQATRGTVPLGRLLDYTPGVFASLHSDFNLDGADSFRHAVFLDTETTGLGTGASVYAFMVGVGTFETLTDFEALADSEEMSPVIGDGMRAPAQQKTAKIDAPTHFVVRQILMRNPAEEQALLSELSAYLEGRQPAVTFNGRSFDLPLLRSRIGYNRPFLSSEVIDAPLLGREAPHLDLLMPARRLWKRRLQSCRLAHLEQKILGHERSEDDVPGYQIPQLYADYLRTGDAREIERVFYHNREDIVSMVSLAAHLAAALDRSTNTERGTVLQGQDWLSLGIAFERMDDVRQAETAYLRALDAVANHTERAEAFLRLGRLQKRQGHWQNAAETWQLWLSSVPGNEPAPYVELAKYCEWKLHDYEQAEMWTAWALHNLRGDGSRFAWSRTIGELEHRLDRIRRKRSREQDGPAGDRQTV